MGTRDQENSYWVRLELRRFIRFLGSHMNSNFTLLGGGSMIPGLTHRIKEEILALVAFSRLVIPDEGHDFNNQQIG